MRTPPSSITAQAIVVLRANLAVGHAGLSARRSAGVELDEHPVGLVAQCRPQDSAAAASDPCAPRDCVTCSDDLGSDGETTCTRAEPGPDVMRWTAQSAGTSTATRPSTNSVSGVPSGGDMSAHREAPHASTTATHTSAGQHRGRRRLTAARRGSTRERRSGLVPAARRDGSASRPVRRRRTDRRHRGAKSLRRSRRASGSAPAMPTGASTTPRSDAPMPRPLRCDHPRVVTDAGTTAAASGAHDDEIRRDLDDRRRRRRSAAQHAVRRSTTTFARLAVRRPHTSVDP